MTCLYVFVLAALANLGLNPGLEQTISMDERQACSCSVSPPPTESGDTAASGSSTPPARRIDRPDHIYNGF